MSRAEARGKVNRHPTPPPAPRLACIVLYTATLKYKYVGNYLHAYLEHY